MPDISGFVLAKRIRAQFGAVHPMLIAISGLYNKEPDKVTGASGGIRSLPGKAVSSGRGLGFAGAAR